jgi:hypothetical protein
MNKNYDYDYEWDSRYCYPKSYVLKNKLGIKDAEQLRLCGERNHISSDSGGKGYRKGVPSPKKPRK